MRRRRYVVLGSTEETTTPLALKRVRQHLYLFRGARAEAPAFIEHLFELNLRCSRIRYSRIRVARLSARPFGGQGEAVKVK